MSQAGVVNIADANPEMPIFFHTQGGPDAVAADNIINFVGAGGITTSSAGNTVTITGTPVALTITGNTGGARPPTASNWNILTSNTNIRVAGSGSTFTLDFGPASQNLFLGSSTASITGGAIGDVGIGYLALNGITSGISNTALGHVSSNTISTGNFNTALGEATLFNSGDVSGSVAIGWHALLGTTANLTIGIGYGAMSAGVSGPGNLGIGTSCFQGALSGQRNLGLGTSVGNSLTTGSFNTFLGNFAAGNLLQTGSYNIFIGDRAGYTYATSESSNILVGNEGTLAESNTLRIGQQGTGNGQQNRAFIAGITGATVTGAGVLCSAAGQLGTVVSSKRYKENIEAIKDDVSILSLTPSTFTYKADEEKKQKFGLIAEEVHEKFPYLCLYNEEGTPETVMYHEIPALLLHEIKKLNSRIECLENQIKER